MDFSQSYSNSRDEIIELFKATFTASEGEDEGKLIAGLVTGIFTTTKDEDIFVFTAWDNGTLVGSIIFTRLNYIQDDRTVFMLSPVAVATDRQGQGIGQELLNFGLNKIRDHSVDVAITYGDPNYYSKVGFMQVTEQQAQPPLKPQYPEGWLAQSLSSAHFEPLRGPSRCVEAFNNSEYW